MANNIRVLSFNMLADGLSAAHPDGGGFTRPVKHISERTIQILSELISSNADIIFIQECDIFHRILNIMMKSGGYIGIFHPKPNGPCFETTGIQDGCAVFIKYQKFRILSVECFQYIHRKEIANAEDGRTRYEDTIESQGGILVAVKWKRGTVILVTTHLKSTKTEEGEQIRLRQFTQLQDHIDMFARANNTREIIIGADLNASPKENKYAPRTYDLLTAYGYVCAYCEFYNKEHFTTLKYRIKDGEPVKAEDIIDYILHSREGRLRPVRLLGLPNRMSISDGLPSDEYPSDHLYLMVDYALVN
jgi:mRNA deadenylase 3'-5' endonuclease subunit Ccr4